MNRNLEAELKEIISIFDGHLPPDQLLEMKELNAAGEPGVAYENLCVQLFEFDVQVNESQFYQIRKLGLAMRIQPKYWERLYNKY
jgi:hypothetical protein